MAVRIKKRDPILLEKNCEFRIGIREGLVLELRNDGYFVFWKPWIDAATGECHDSSAEMISYNAVANEDSYGRLRVLKRPLAMASPVDQVRRAERVAIEVARMEFRKQYVLAVQDLLDAGKLELVRRDFEARVVDIAAAGLTYKRFFISDISGRGEGRRHRRCRKYPI